MMCSQVSTGRSLASKATQTRKNTGRGGVRRRNSASSGVGMGRQVEDLAAAVDPALWAAGALAAYTGLRASELVALRVRHLNCFAAVARLASGDRGGWAVGVGRPRPPPDTRRRCAFLCDQLAVSLAERPHGPDDLVFTAPQGGRLREQRFVAGPSGAAARADSPDVASRKQRSRSQTCSRWWRWGDSNSGPASQVLPARRPHRSLTCGSSRTDSDRWCPQLSPGRRPGVTSVYRWACDRVMLPPLYPLVSS